MQKKFNTICVLSRTEKIQYDLCCIGWLAALLLSLLCHHAQLYFLRMLANADIQEHHSRASRGDCRNTRECIYAMSCVQNDENTSAKSAIGLYFAAERGHNATCREPMFTYRSHHTHTMRYYVHVLPPLDQAQTKPACCTLAYADTTLVFTYTAVL